jgi:hypothetical protein|nr:MAG TPA: hypothetical protein [Caudoviricetes sp.]
MNKIEAYKEVYGLVEMVECILDKFHSDMLENHIADSVFCCYEDYFTIYHPMEGYIKSNNAILVATNGEYILNMLTVINKYEDFGWNPYLTALKLGIEKISSLMQEEVE